MKASTLLSRLCEVAKDGVVTKYDNETSLLGVWMIVEISVECNIWAVVICGRYCIKYYLVDS